MKRILPLFTILLFSAYQAAGAGQIQVCGDVYGKWSADTVLVACDIRIPADSHLTIMAGVKVLFDGPWKMTMDSNAQISANGSAGSRIVFAPLTEGSTWRGMRMNSCCGLSILNYCDFRHSSAVTAGDTLGGAIALRSSSMAIYNCTFDSCSASAGGAISCAKGSNPLITNSTFQWNSAAHAGAIMCDSGSSPLILADTFRYNNARDAGATMMCLERANATIEECVFTDNTVDSIVYSGGGVIYVQRAGVEIRRNLISHNLLPFMYAILCQPGLGPDIIVEIVGNTISDNVMTGGIGVQDCAANITDNIISNNHGIGISCSNGTMNVVRNTITGNGGGINTLSSAATIKCNRITGNHCSSGGGVAVLLAGGNPVIEHNIISGNSATEGGGVFVYYCDGAIIRSNLIVNNTATGFGAGIYVQRSTIDSIEHNTIANNIADSAGSAISGMHATVTVKNSVIYGNEPSENQVYLRGISTLHLDSCDIEGGYADGTGNIDVDPLFRDAANGDFHAQSGTILTKPLATCGGFISDSMEVWIVPTPTPVPDKPPLSLPGEFSLGQNYPNPFNPSTSIEFTVPTSMRVTVEVFDLLGRRVRALVDSDVPAGHQVVQWNGTDAQGRAVSSGLYLCRLTGANRMAVTKMLLLK